MTSLAAGLSKALPAPKYSAEEDVTASRKPTARVLGGGDPDQQGLILKRTGPPPYGRRSAWRPRSADDFGDGGAFPEVPMAQYPLDMGRKRSGTSKALTLQVDNEGKVKYDAIARQGHNDKRIVHASFKDLIPLRQRADVGEISLERPSEEDVAATTEKTRQALARLVSGAVAAQKPKNVKGTNRKDAQYVRYTPSNQLGDTTKRSDKIIKIVERQQDPMEPPKFKHKKIPRGPPSPPPPVMHSPPRKLTAADQEAWTIPPPVSNWKNPKGYTVPLDKRLAADGRGLQDVTINDKFAQFAEALFTADRHAREEIKQRALMQQKLAEKEKSQKEEHLRMLAQKAREAAHTDSRSDDEARKMQMLAREQGRDIGEKIALGLAKPTQSQETMWDSRLFNQSSAFGAGSGFNEDQPYDKPLFAAQEAANSIYRPKVSVDDDDEDTARSEMDRIKRNSRFEVLGKAQQGFRGAADAEARDGPVQFEKDAADPFGVEAFVKAAGEKAGTKHGLQERDSSPGGSKRSRANYM
ncbi:unnamed protein product [Tuber melanosporum]|uniref:Pre-mRNA-processing protein 45 n=1 Tax=Tuber melanosporum (strain Mel28) TaxID=656061 RepID=D5GKM7_TUBMM|nr:uncharacterized protein GSTUM_00009646001 [Tuber melanosporum]CAZ85070.1 unnamed protein product [Tuber melanosporum]